MNVSEEFKEALLRAKGQPALFVMLKDDKGEISVLPDTFKLVDYQPGKPLILEPVKATEPSQERREVVKQILSNLRKTIHADIEQAVEKALLEKTDEQLVNIITAKEARLEHRRGCFWLISPTEEICL